MVALCAFLTNVHTFLANIGYENIKEEFDGYLSSVSVHLHNFKVNFDSSRHQTKLQFERNAQPEIVLL